MHAFHLAKGYQQVSLTNVRIVQPGDYNEQPWRNGAGVSHEISRYPEASARWRWRLSVARIEEDGPMSVYAGHRRWMGLLQGNGLRLRPEGERVLHLSSPGDEDIFPGQVACTAELIDGPVRVLNLIAGNDVTHRAKQVKGSETFVLASTMDVAIHTAGGSCQITCGDDSWSLPADATWLASLEDLVFLDVETQGNSLALVLTIDRSDMPSARSTVTAQQPHNGDISPPGPEESPAPEEADIDPDQFPRRARVAVDWTPANAPPHGLSEGDVVIVGNSDPRWSDWVRFTTARGHNGWVPRAWLAEEGMRGKLLQSHQPRELSVVAGEEIELIERQLGWVRARKLDGAEGWLPPCCIDA